MENSQLYHHGIKGMKWGVRRYQNKDGTLTAAGKKRMYTDMFDQESKDPKEQRKYTAEPNKWTRENRERTKQVVDDSKNMTQNLRTLNKATTPAPKKAKLDLSKMSDKEMRDEINRALLERQYNDMFAPQKTSKGRERVDRVLEVGGAVLGVTSSALAIALSIQKLMGK